MNTIEKKRVPIDKTVVNLYICAKKIKIFGVIIMIALILLGILTTVNNTYEAYNAYLGVEESYEQFTGEEVDDSGILIDTITTGVLTAFKFFAITVIEFILYNTASAVVVGYANLIHCRFTETNLALEEHDLKNYQNSEYDPRVSNISLDRIYTIQKLYDKGVISVEEYDMLLHD